MVASLQQRICIGPQVPAGSQDPVSILLPNPSSGLPSRYVIQDGQLYELQASDSEGLRSWFIEDTVQSDGSLYLITPMDPVFMFIPILDIMRKKTQGTEGRFLILEDIFESDQYASLRQLIQLQHIERYLRLVCEVRDSSALKTFRLEDAKVMSWLKRKVEVLVNKFEMVPALRNSIAYTESLPEACRSDSWATELSAKYQFPELEKLESRTQLPSSADFGKRGMDLDEEPKAKDVKKPKMSVGQRKLAKASTAGMKPLSSFFAKKAS
ncbi:hypothetical protein BGZ68_002097 [Mortierella alpina]|nr:hypothetical protein BGZ68_002097 [Mortierella alpina]